MIYRKLDRLIYKKQLKPKSTFKVFNVSFIMHYVCIRHNIRVSECAVQIFT